jgi:cytochrome c-type biogenesis protein CcmH
MRTIRYVSVFGAAIMLMLAAAGAVRAVEPDEMLADPALEARARELSKGLRCLVCRNQTIDDSNAELARDLRVLLRERISAGDSDQEAMNYLVDRYGPYILLKPPVTAATILLWAGPALLLVFAGAGFGIFLRRQRGAAGAAEPIDTLSADEREIVRAALENGIPK